jgi:small ligand-binding sensory domain FIST
MLSVLTTLTVPNIANCFGTTVDGAARDICSDAPTSLVLCASGTKETACSGARADTGDDSFICTIGVNCSAISTG